MLKSKNKKARKNRDTAIDTTRPRSESALAPWERDYDRFMGGVRVRLRQGEQEYQDRSFSADPADLLSEIEQELLDVCGWSFLLWTRLQKVRAAMPGHDNGKDYADPSES